MDGFGNDTIDVRDGEQDSVQCGPGDDTVTADAIDTVADDCEHVARGWAAAAGGATKAGATLRVTGSRRIADVLRHGLVVHVPSSKRVTVRARIGRTLVARGSGRRTVRVRLTGAGRRRLRQARRAVLTLSAGNLRGRVVLSRAR
jgi:hypothetical protein